MRAASTTSARSGTSRTSPSQRTSRARSSACASSRPSTTSQSRSAATRYEKDFSAMLALPPLPPSSISSPSGERLTPSVSSLSWTAPRPTRASTSSAGSSARACRWHTIMRAGRSRTSRGERGKVNKESDWKDVFWGGRGYILSKFDFEGAELESTRNCSFQIRVGI